MARIRISAYSNWTALFLLWISLPHSTSFAQILDMTGKISSRGQSCGKKPILNFLRSGKIFQATNEATRCNVPSPNSCGLYGMLSRGTFLQLPAAKWGSWKGSSFTMCHAMQNGSSWELPMTFSRSCLPSRLTGVDVTETQTHFIIVSYNMYIQYTYYRTTLVIYFSFYHHIFIIYLNLNLVCIHIIYIYSYYIIPSSPFNVPDQ